MARVPHTRYVRHRHLSRLRYSTVLLTWMQATATKLGTTMAQVFHLLKGGMSASQINALAASGDKAPANTAVPTITGTATVGQTLTSTTGTWTGTPTPTYTRQWFRDSTAIAGATAATYVLVSADATHTIKVVVTGTNAIGKATATSAATAAVAAS